MLLKNLLYIGNRLSGKGLNVTTIETLSNHLIGEGYSVISVSDKKNPIFRMLEMLWVVAKYRKTDYVLIDTYSTSAFWFSFSVSQLCRMLNKKYIPILHGGNLPNRLKNNPKLCSMLFGNAYKNVAPSHYLLHEFEKKGYTNVLFIPNSIEINRYSFKQRNTIGPKLLWVRAFASIYNPKMAIDVLYAIKKSYPDASLCMVGPDKDGSGELTKKYADELGLSVSFTGRLAKADWIAKAKAYDIFINTTHFDNTPVSVMEAMALGLPVVTTNVGGIPILLKDKEDALLVQDNDIAGMVKSIIALIEKPVETQRIIQQARNKAENWDWEVVKEHWRALLG